jgi:hypothetical protein
MAGDDIVFVGLEQTEGKMEFSDDCDDRLVRDELVHAFRLIEKWSRVDEFNSVARASIWTAKCAIQTVLEHLSLAEREIEEVEEEEERKAEEQEEQKWQGECEELCETIDQILDNLPSPGERPGYRKVGLTAGEARIVADAVQHCLRNRPPSPAEAVFISALLQEYRRSF